MLQGVQHHSHLRRAVEAEATEQKQPPERKPLLIAIEVEVSEPKVRLKVARHVSSLHLIVVETLG